MDPLWLIWIISFRGISTLNFSCESDGVSGVVGGGDGTDCGGGKVDRRGWG